MYLVKKNPEQPADGNNWIVMNMQEDIASLRGLSLIGVILFLLQV